MDLKQSACLWITLLLSVIALFNTVSTRAIYLKEQVYSFVVGLNIVNLTQHCAKPIAYVALLTLNDFSVKN